MEGVQRTVRRHEWGARRLIVALVAVLITLPTLVVEPAAAAPPSPAAQADLDGTSAGLARINEARAAIGIPPLQRHQALDAAAAAHANYYKLNFGDPSLAGMGLHYEDPAKPGFTGTDFAARARKQGYSGSINENIGLSGDMLVSVNWFLDTVNHRLTLLDPRYTDIGFGVVNEGSIKIEVIDLGTVVWRATIEPAWEPWPPADATKIGLRFDGETPNPFAGATYPIGYPITLKYNGAGAVSYTAVKLVANGQTVPSLSQTGSGFITRNTQIVAATKPLSPGTTYTITIDGAIDGKPFSRSWSFTTLGAPGASPSPVPDPLPPGVAKIDPTAASRWKAADYDVWRGAAQRTWTWGPDVVAIRQEPYAEVTGGARTVYYFDKSRMEINNPAGDRTSPWFITNGLLVREMIAGQIQTGDQSFTTRAPATLPLAGESVNSTAATYATLAGVASLSPGQNSAPNQSGQSILATIDVNGAIGTQAGLEGAARYGYYEPTLGHNIADVFWRWLGQQPVDWLYAVGYPLAEPYWTQAKINGEDVWVLVQAFERRILTFVPTNSPGWQVEAGNVGRHYYEWRYGEPPRLSEEKP